MSPRPTLFALEDTSAQFTWRASTGGPMAVRCGAEVREIVLDGGPGSCIVSGLTPDSAYVARFDRPHHSPTTIAFRTLASPPGPELFRFATVSDLHLGRTHFGLRHSITEPGVDVPHPTRCARAAANDLTEWGAERLIIKGDLVDSSSPHCWALAGDLVNGLAIPYTVIPGNHEMAHGSVSPRAQAGIHGIDLVSDVEILDVPGIRLIMMDSTVEDIDVGRWNHIWDQVATAAAEADGPAMVLVHHQPQRTPVPVYFPAGISSFSANRLLRTLARANPATMGTSGHTHRHRRHTLAGLPWTEVGSTKDYPGAWAGYAVHEGGIRQVVRRVSRPDCLSWTDRTRAAAGGAWALWSPGRLNDRCYTHVWPTRD